MGVEETTFSVNGRGYVVSEGKLVEESSGRPLAPRRVSQRWYQAGTGAARAVLHVAATQLQKDLKVSEDYLFEPMGTGPALRALLNRQADWVVVGRDLLTDERMLGYRSETVAWDALRVVVPRSLPVEDLTVRRLAALFTGEITNWRDAGGPDLPVLLGAYTERAGAAGTFRDLVLERIYGDDGRLPASAVRRDYEPEILAWIAAHPGAIGFVPFSLDSVELPAEVKVLAIDKIVAEESEILAGRYPLARPINFVTVGEAEGRARDILDRLLGERVQAALPGLRLVPVQ